MKGRDVKTMLTTGLFGLGLGLMVCGFASSRKSGHQAPDPSQIFADHCMPCHDSANRKGGLDLTLALADLAKRSEVVAGDADASLLIKRVTGTSSGELMPKGRAALSDDEVGVIRAWIASLKQTGVSRYSDKGVNAQVQADLADFQKSDPAGGEFIRYLSFYNLHGNDRLESYHQAAGLLLNSLSFAPQVYSLVKVDDEGLLYRIDLRQVGWTAKSWEVLTAGYPYGSPVTWIRGDWFLAHAATPERYYRLLGLPDHLDQRDGEGKLVQPGLESQLGGGSEPRSINRVELPRSEVAAGKRVLERLDGQQGYFWRASDVDPKTNQVGGSEIIFSLPNGLQGYFAVNREGKRIEEQEPALVSAKTPLSVGMGCMGCHQDGLRLISNSQEAEVLRLSNEVNRQIRRDQTTFLQSLLGHFASKGASSSLRELVAEYENSKVDLEVAAGELGVPSGQLKALAGPVDPDFKALQAGGSVSRVVWERLYGRVRAAVVP